jgi:hypothetical protein
MEFARGKGLLVQEWSAEGVGGSRVGGLEAGA